MTRFEVHSSLCQGALLLREVDRKIGLLRRLARCFTDAPDPERVEYPPGEMLAQRTCGLHPFWRDDVFKPCVDYVSEAGLSASDVD